MKYHLTPAHGHANQPAALSLGTAGLGINATALGAFYAVQAGQPVGLVISDMMAPIRPQPAGGDVGLSTSDVLGYVPRGIY